MNNHAQNFPVLCVFPIVPKNVPKTVKTLYFYDRFKVIIYPDLTLGTCCETDVRWIPRGNHAITLCLFVLSDPDWFIV